MAIEVTELMIGNWVYWRNEPYQVDLDHFRFYIIFEPIPLTSEILSKIEGFKERYNGTFWQLSDELLICVDAVFWWTNYWEASDEFGFEPIVPYKKIEYLHALQNLIKSLTGNDFKIKL